MPSPRGAVSPALPGNGQLTYRFAPPGDRAVNQTEDIPAMTRLPPFPRIAAAFATLLAFPAFGDTIATDRPDFVESSNVVGAGRWQIETSVAYEHDSAEGVDTRTWATPTLLRIGLGDYWELRAETDGFLSQDTGDRGFDDQEDGFADTALGLKWHIPGSEQSGPSLGVLFHVDLDSGSEAFQGEGLRPSIRVVAEWEIGENMSFGLMPGLVSDKDDNGERFTAGILGAVLGYSLNERLRVFGELAAEQIASGSHGGDVLNFDVGTAWLLSDDAQLDAAASFGLTDETPEWAVTLGYSIRF